jgi:hypothetical protein
MQINSVTTAAATTKKKELFSAGFLDTSQFGLFRDYTNQRQTEAGAKCFRETMKKT